MHVFQTAGVPPSKGSAILANIGCTMNRSAAETKTVSENSATTATFRIARAGSRKVGTVPGARSWASG